MPRPILAVCSFWVHRPDDFPQAANYLALLRILEASCRRLGVAHVVLTDRATCRDINAEGMTYFARDLPRNLMEACTEAQALWLEHRHAGPLHTLFTGADAVLLKDPRPHLPEADLCLTLRPGHPRYPINTGFQFVSNGSRERVASLYRRIAERCGPKWCDDQRAIQDELTPMPMEYGTVERHGLKVAFLPMKPFNVVPKSPRDPSPDSVLLHFRGKDRKQLMLDWAKANGFAGPQ